MKVTIEGLEGLGVLSGLSEQRMQAAVINAMHAIAYDVRDEVKREMQSAFDRPTPYVLNAIRVRRFAVGRPYVEVGYKDDGRGGASVNNVLLPHVDGGARAVKRLEYSLRAYGFMPAGWYAVPGQGARIDGFGNMDRGQVVQILSQLRINLIDKLDREMPRNARGQIKNQRKAGGRFFVIPPGQRIAPGVYQREFMGRNITPVVMFVRSIQYSRRFDFDGIATRTVDRVMDGHVTKAIAQQVERSMRPGTQGALW